MSMSEPSEKPFQIAIPEERLAHLRARLDLTTFPDELEDVGWNYGVPKEDLKRLVSRWKDTFDWRQQEAQLNNELPDQFTRDIQVEGHGTLNIHYVHRKSATVDAVPLLFVHGWPGSFLEIRKILPLLTASSPEHPSFHVVALSLPGFGFSEAAKHKGFAHPQIAEVGNKLMLALGYNEYVTQGGDWGYSITRTMASLYGGKSLKAWHSNFAPAHPPTLSGQPLEYILSFIAPWSAKEKLSMDRTNDFVNKGRGYSALQATKPQTLGYSLADSPVGLLAWIYEKLVIWSDGYPWDDDEVLTWVSIYWFSRAGPSASLRIYYEHVNSDASDPKKYLPGNTPVGLSFFPKEIVNYPKKWVRRIGNVVFESEHEFGGHFAAHEKPQELVSDLHKMFGKGGPAFGVVSGRTGY